MPLVSTHDPFITTLHINVTIRYCIDQITALPSQVLSNTGHALYDKQKNETDVLDQWTSQQRVRYQVCYQTGGTAVTR